MQIKNKFNLDIKPAEWLYIMAAIIITKLLIRGDIQGAITALTQWLPKVK